MFAALPSLNNLKITRKLGLVMVLPIVALLTLSALLINQEYENSSQLKKLEKLVGFSPSVTSLVHELQKERGLSAAFLSSGGKASFRQKVAAQYTETDTFRKHLTEALAGFNRADYGPELSKRIDQVMANLDKLEAKRADVGALKASVGEMAKYYTGTIKSMLGSVSHMALLSDNATILGRVVGYINFLQAKEYAGQERAMGAAGFGLGQFLPKVHQRFVALIAEQDALLAVFRQFATPEQLALYDNEMQASDVSEVARMRKTAKNSVYNTDFKNTVSGSQWFDTITLKINRLKTVENKLSGDLLALSGTLAAQADTKLMTLIAGILISLALTALFSILIGRSITRPIHNITGQMNGLAANDLTVEVEGLNRKDEIGEMAKAVQVFKENALRNEQLEATQAEQQKRQDADEAEQRAQDEARAAERKLVADSFGKAMSAIATKDLSYRITEEFPASDQQLKEDFNSSIEQLAVTVDQMGVASAQILSGSSEIHNAAGDLASRTEQQAATVEETAASLEETTVAMETSSKSAKEVGNLVATTKKNAEHSGEIVRNAISAMGKIENSSTEINNIISVIEDISFQTNLLALNAGVEAARAGDAGKGFAVVAQEVRELAHRSASSAKEIKALITTSGEDVKTGASLVNETGEALESIVAEVTEINDHVASIVAAASEQSIGLAEINQSVNSIDQGTQQNAAVAEQSTAASYSLSQEVEKIDRMLQVFNTTEAGSKTKPVAASKASDPQASPARELTKKVANSFSNF